MTDHTPTTQSVVVPVRGPGHCDDDAAWAEFVRQYDGQHRSRPDLTDFALANYVFMADRNDLDLIVWQTAAKERIRWLSIELAKAQAELSAAPAPSREEVAWTWGTFGSDTDGAPIQIKGTFGDYSAVVTKSRSDGLWSATINKGHGRLGFKAEEIAMAYVEETVAELLSKRLNAARETVALYDAALTPCHASAQEPAK